MTNYKADAKPGERNECDSPNVDWERRSWESNWVPVCKTCGLIVDVETREHTEQGWPISETGLYVYKHRHQWVEISWDLGPNGWKPRYRCTVCTDELQDLHATPFFADPDA